MKHSMTALVLRAARKTSWIIVMTVFAVIFAYPFIFSLLASFMKMEDFNTMGSLWVWPRNPTLEHYKVYLNLKISGALRPFLHSVARSAWATFINVSIAMLGGYTLARYEFKIKKGIIIGIVAAQVIPWVLTMIPTFLLISRIPFVGGNNWMGFGGHGLINNILVLFIPIGWGVFLWAFLFMQSVKGFPRSFEEAAEIDGYGFWAILLKIVLPMQGPILAVIAINTALSTWNDWFTPFLYINRTQDSTLTAWLGTLATELQKFGEKNYPSIFALGTLAVIPAFAIFFFFQKYIIQGISSVGIKG